MSDPTQARAALDWATAVRSDWPDHYSPDEAKAWIAAIDRAEYAALAALPDDGLIPLATRYADHKFHPEDHQPDDECWTNLYRAIVGLDAALPDDGREGLVRTRAAFLADLAARAVTEPRRFHESADQQHDLSVAIADMRAALAAADKP